MATFAERLRTLREQNGETQQDVADLIGVTRNAISSYESGKRRPSGKSAFSIYEKIAEHYNVDIPYLIGQEKESEPKVYLVFIHNNHGLEYGGYFSTKEKAKAVCDEWNKINENEDQFADFINVTDEKDNEFILERGY